MEWIFLAMIVIGGGVGFVRMVKRDARRSVKAWTRLAPTMRSAAKRPPPVKEGYAPSGLEREDGRETIPHRIFKLGHARFKQFDHPLRGAAFTIDYTDANGDQTRRRIRVIGVSNLISKPGWIEAHCYEREAQRRFRVDRISRVIDEDGVVHEPLTYLEYLARRRAFIQVSQGRLDDIANGVVVLMALGRADGRLVKKERQVIVEFVRATALRKAVPRDDEVYLVEEGDLAGFRPDFGMIENALAWIAGQSQEDQIEFLSYCRELIEADGNVTDSEASTLVAIEKEILGRETDAAT